MRGRKGLDWGDPAPCSALWPQNLIQITVWPPLAAEGVGDHSAAQRRTPTAESWCQSCSQGSGPRGGSEAQRAGVCPVAAGLGAPRKAGKQRLSETVEQPEAALGEKSGPETRSWAHLGASWGPGGHSAQALCRHQAPRGTSQAPASAPRSDWGMGPLGWSHPQKASTLVHGWPKKGGAPESYRGATVR